MDICFFSVFALFCVSIGLATGCSASKASYQLSAWLIILEWILSGNRP
jgi:hypothetical protein